MIPCMLHTLMSLVKSLRKVLIIEIQNFPEAVAIFRTALSLLVKLPEDPKFDLTNPSTPNF